MKPDKIRIVNVSKSDEPSFEVLYNPTEYSLDHAVSYAELQVPGLQGPIYQFVRGDADTLTLELFLAKTNDRQSVETELANLRQFVTIDGDLHAPPVCRIEWGGRSSGTSGEERANNLSFTGVVQSLRERLQLFDEHGAVLRARVTMTLKRFQAAEVQLREINRSSPDRTRVRVFREGETLQQIAAEHYGDPRLWRKIAEANDIDRPRFIRAGTPLRLPAI